MLIPNSVYQLRSFHMMKTTSQTATRAFSELFFHPKAGDHILGPLPLSSAKVSIIILDEGNLCSVIKTRVREATWSPVEQLCSEVRLLPPGLFCLPRSMLSFESQRASLPHRGVPSYSRKRGGKRHYTQGQTPLQMIKQML